NYVFRHKSFREFLAGIELVKKVHRISAYLDPIIESFGEDWWDEPLRFFISHGDEELFDLFMDKLFSSNVSDDVLHKKQGFLRTLIEEAPMKKPDALCVHLMNHENSAMRQRVILDCIKAVDKGSAIGALQQFQDANLEKRDDVSYRTAEILNNLTNQGHAKSGLFISSISVATLVRKIDAQNDSSKKLSVDHFGQQVEYILIPGGSYVYSVTKKEEHVPDLYFAKYPVTNRLYGRFIEYLQFKNPESEANLPVSQFIWVLQDIANKNLWDKYFVEYLQDGKKNIAGLFRSKYYEDRKFGADENPVVGISWYAAISYCLWLSLLESKGERNDLYRLPTEIEWEWAAAGKDKRKFPWGSAMPTPKLANYYEINIGATTPVGAYPDGATPEGLYDMAGNVWEWMENWHDNRQYFRALRGGSWDSDAEYLRCSSRNYGSPGNWDGDVGFRVVRPSPLLEP
ncbi:MAG: formylglycine-generating enzyme family protein, partial [Chlorobaculum sp.]|nr:formylglycine-generating enzyme family protein [Chlorobaculum sp.]